VNRVDWSARAVREECSDIRGLVENMIDRLERDALKDMKRERQAFWENIHLPGVVDRQRRLLELLAPHRIDFKRQRQGR
jgi:hypothetical protein